MTRRSSCNRSTAVPGRSSYGEAPMRATSRQVTWSTRFAGVCWRCHSTSGGSRSQVGRFLLSMMLRSRRVVFLAPHSSPCPATARSCTCPRRR